MDNEVAICPLCDGELTVIRWTVVGKSIVCPCDLCGATGVVTISVAETFLAEVERLNREHQEKYSREYASRQDEEV